MGMTNRGGTFESLLTSVGNTPLVRVNRLVAPDGAMVFAKMENRNPAFSVKCRIAQAMLIDAEEREALHSGMTIVEPTSGNLGIALALAAAVRHYPLRVTMPESASLERRQILEALGAQVILTDAASGMYGAVLRAQEIVGQHPSRFHMLHQFQNPANPAAHERTTGPEIWRDTNGQVDVFITGVGTGGTITGVARFFRRQMSKRVLAIAVEPAESPVLEQRRRGAPLQPGPHRIEGIGVGFIPKVLDLDLVDRIEAVTSDEAAAMTRRLATEEGMLCGISSGAVMTATVRLAKQPEFRGKTVVAVLGDSGERYLSTSLFHDTARHL